MKKPLIIGIGAVVILSFLIYFLLLQRPADNMSIIQEAFAGSGSASCTFVEPDTQEEFSMNIKAGKMRVSGESEGYEFFLMLKDEFIYLWDNYESYGIRIPVQESYELGSPFSSLNDEGVFLEEVGNYVIDCSAVSLDDSLFDLPEEIEFFDSNDIFDPEIDFEIEDFEVEDGEVMTEEELEALFEEMMREEGY